MKLLQLNIWEGRLLRSQLLPFLKNTNADILCLQEVYSCEANVHEPDIFDSLEQITQATGLEHVFFSPAMEIEIGGVVALQGNAILSRYPISNKQTVFTSGQYAKQEIKKGYHHNIRNAQLCTINLDNDMSLSLSNHHGFWHPSEHGTEETTTSMKVWVDALMKMSSPLIACGDLNISSESSAMRLFDSFLSDLTATNNVKTTLSKLGVVEEVACDHILVSEKIRVDRFEVSEELVSDHKALILDFELI